MSDLIDRQDAIDLIEDIETKILKGEVEMMYAPAIKGLRRLPSVQSDLPNTCPDAISRQAAIDAILAQSTHNSARELYEYTIEHPTAQWDIGLVDAIDAVIAVDDLPSAQPDLMPCDLCRYNPPSSMDGKPCTMCPAERREDV